MTGHAEISAQVLWQNSAAQRQEKITLKWIFLTPTPCFFLLIPSLTILPFKQFYTKRIILVQQYLLFHELYLLV